MTRNIHITTKINNQPYEFLAPSYMSLLDALREIVGLTGTKEGCLDALVNFLVFHLKVQKMKYLRNKII